MGQDPPSPHQSVHQGFHGRELFRQGLSDLGGDAPLRLLARAGRGGSFGSQDHPQEEDSPSGSRDGRKARQYAGDLPHLLHLSFGAPQFRKGKSDRSALRDSRGARHAALSRPSSLRKGAATPAPPESFLARIIHERLQPSRGSFPSDTSSD